MFANFSREFSLISQEGQMDVRAMALLAFALLCATSPLELSQITFALVGAVTYALVQATQLSLGKRHCERGSSKVAPGCGGCRLKYSGSGPLGGPRTPPTPPARAVAAPLAAPAIAQPEVPVAQAPRAEVRQPSSQPIAPLTLAASGWDAEVEELLGLISPTQEGDRVVQQLLRLVKQTLRKLIPEIEVVGFATGDLVRGTAFGVAVPEVDIIVSASTEVLSRNLQGRLLHRGAMAQQHVDPRKLQKSAVRACTDRLVSVGGFKFRRSAFRGQEPKVTLLVPAVVGIHSEAIPIDFSVNATTPLYNAAMLVDCGHLELRARSLILLVKRWSKDRGICHAAKGHLSPYAWTLLIIYFLQVGAEEDGVPVLPPFQKFEVCSEITRQPSLVKAFLSGPSAATALGAKPAHVGLRAGQRPVGVLFHDFVHFYSKVFDWSHEAASISSAVRAPPNLLLPLHILLHEDGVTTKLGPSIEDPFDSKRNLGEGTSVAGMARLQEELSRADELLSRGASLTELLEPWVPPDRCGGSDGNGDEEAPSCFCANAGSIQ